MTSPGFLPRWRLPTQTGKLNEARAEHERLQAKADTASKRMTKLESQLADLDESS